VYSWCGTYTVHVGAEPVSQSDYVLHDRQTKDSHQTEARTDDSNNNNNKIFINHRQNAMTQAMTMTIKQLPRRTALITRYNE